MKCHIRVIVGTAFAEMRGVREGRMNCHRSRVIVLDDNPLTLRETSEILTPYYDVEQLTNSETLFSHFEEHDVNLIVLSAALIARHFAAIIAEIHQNWNGLPVVLTYRNDEHGQRMRNHYESIATAVASCPLEPDSFRVLVERVLESHPFSTRRAETTGAGGM